MPNVRTDMTVSLDRYICGLAAQQPPYLDNRFHVLDAPAVTRLGFRFPTAA
ncbi:hypothetical protein [Nocardia sp. NPDC004123]